MNRPDIEEHLQINLEMLSKYLNLLNDESISKESRKVAECMIHLIKQWIEDNQYALLLEKQFEILSKIVGNNCPSCRIKKFCNELDKEMIETGECFTCAETLSKYAIIEAEKQLRKE